MPVIAAAMLVLALLLLLMLALPLSIVQRYRLGTTRRLARGWVATFNVVMMSLSAVMFLFASALTTLWVPQALTYAAAGLAGGCVLGVIGLALTRWENDPRSLHYTPNHWLVLGISVVVIVRVAYGFWRGWHAWQATPQDSTWLAASGAAGSLAAGGVVLGYYLCYWFGVRRRTRKPARMTGGARVQ